MAEKLKPLTKTQLAKELGVSRSSLYYKPKRPALDEEIKHQIESVMTDHPGYGHKRIALSLKLNKKRILRVMKKFDLKPTRRRRKPPSKPNDRGQPAVKSPNVAISMCAVVADYIWVSDFTYIKFGTYFIYLATIVDMHTRVVLGWNISRYHNQELVLGALEHALQNPDHNPPAYLHSDQGSEYRSQAYVATAESLGIAISMSHKSSPWENAYQESFYSHFKVDLGDPNRFDTLGELIEGINHTIHYYNTRRMHSILKMPPVEFRKTARRFFSQHV